MTSAAATTNYYDLLGLPRTCTTEEINKAYKKLALKHHPDKGGSDKMFQALSHAKDILIDAKKRDEYDRKTAPVSSSSFGTKFPASGSTRYYQGRYSTFRSGFYNAGEGTYTAHYRSTYFSAPDPSYTENPYQYTRRQRPFDGSPFRRSSNDSTETHSSQNAQSRESHSNNTHSAGTSYQEKRSAFFRAYRPSTTRGSTFTHKTWGSRESSEQQKHAYAAPEVSEEEDVEEEEEDETSDVPQEIRDSSSSPKEKRTNFTSTRDASYNMSGTAYSYVSSDQPPPSPSGFKSFKVNGQPRAQNSFTQNPPPPGFGDDEEDDELREGTRRDFTRYYSSSSRQRREPEFVDLTNEDDEEPTGVPESPPSPQTRNSFRQSSSIPSDEEGDEEDQEQDENDEIERDEGVDFKEHDNAFFEEDDSEADSTPEGLKTPSRRNKHRMHQSGDEDDDNVTPDQQGSPSKRPKLRKQNTGDNDYHFIHEAFKNVPPFTQTDGNFRMEDLADSIGIKTGQRAHRDESSSSEARRPAKQARFQSTSTPINAERPRTFDPYAQQKQQQQQQQQQQEQRTKLFDLRATNEALLINVPVPPSAPSLQSVTSDQLRRYSHAIATYQDEWNVYNAKMTEYHRMRNEADRSYGISYLESQQGLEEYVNALQTDYKVKALWQAAFERHVLAMKQFAEVKLAVDNLQAQQRMHQMRG
ncbi:hypothetical protein TRVA0_012S02586 [Trichomonascus vanleenenianus]|uniref:J domain-containing protein n=1 Tax=Trichomonascus vanleenenianus TaxID=2268995 RepID=UPI003ECA514E